MRQNVIVAFGKSIHNTLEIKQFPNTLEIKQFLSTGMYLALPYMIGINAKSFEFIKDIVQKKINFWSSKCMSEGGRNVLLKFVLEATPSYITSIFLLPNVYY